LSHPDWLLTPPPSPPPPYREEVDALARRLRLKLFRTSVKEDFNVNEGRCVPEILPGGSKWGTG